MQVWKKAALCGFATFVFLAIACSEKPLAGQSGFDLSRTTQLAANDSWPEINLNVVVLDKHGTPQKVDAAGFQLSEDGAKRPFGLRESAESPISIGFIVDISGSMHNSLGPIVTVVNGVVKGLPEGSEVMVVAFNETAFLDLPFTPVSKADLSFLWVLPTRSVTTLYDSTIEAEKYFAAHAHYLRRALVLIGDGGDNASRSGLADAIRSLQRPGAPTFYSYFVPNDFVESRHNKRAMELLAMGGGGVVFTAPKDKNYAPTAARLADMIRSQYVLSFTAADPASDGNAHKLDVRLPTKDLQVMTLPIYYAPGK